MNDLKIVTFCTFVILFTIGNLLIMLSYKLRALKKVIVLLAFNILSIFLMKVYCRDAGVGVAGGELPPKFWQISLPYSN